MITYFDKFVSCPMLTASYQNKEIGTRIMILIKSSLDYTHAGLNNDKKKKKRLVYMSGWEGESVSTLQLITRSVLM